jgi:hypothetical protein
MCVCNKEVIREVPEVLCMVPNMDGFVQANTPNALPHGHPTGDPTRPRPCHVLASEARMSLLDSKLREATGTDDSSGFDRGQLPSLWFVCKFVE